MAENNGTRVTVTKALKGMHAIPVENGYTHTGTPDVSYIGGWLELKYKRAWPKRPSTIVKLEHFTQDQKNFMLKDQRLGGNPLLVLQVGRWWGIFDPQTATEKIGKMNTEETKAAAIKSWPNGLNKKEFFDYIDETRLRHLSELLEKISTRRSMGADGHSGRCS